MESGFALRGAEDLPRRRFLQSSAVVCAGALLPRVARAAVPPAPLRPPQIPLGFDNFSIRALGWDADRLIEFAIEQRLDSVLLSDLDVYRDHSAEYLRGLRKKAEDGGVVIHAGTGGICPTSQRFNGKWGSPQEHLTLGLNIAQHLGSPVFRCYLGGAADRQVDGGIQRQIDETVKVLKSVESLAVDRNIRIAVENHAGDMQARELVGLIEAAGPHFVGATLDSGNATWTLESPLGNLRRLGKYAVSSGIRDSTVWMTETGAKVAWNAVGAGQVDWKTYTAEFAQRCPGVPFQLEIISGFHREIPFQQDDFWDAYRDVRASDYEEFLRLARQGKAIPTGKSGDAEYQMNELITSIRYCREQLGLGLKPAEK